MSTENCVDNKTENCMLFRLKLPFIQLLNITDFLKPMVHSFKDSPREQITREVILNQPVPEIDSSSLCFGKAVSNLCFPPTIFQSFPLKHSCTFNGTGLKSVLSPISKYSGHIFYPLYNLNNSTNSNLDVSGRSSRQKVGENLQAKCTG